MLDCTSLRSATDRLAGRFRVLPQSRLRGGAAETGLDLARWLAAEAQRLEFPGREPVLMPDDGAFTVGDQIAVAGHDLALVLEPRPECGGVLEAALVRIDGAARRAGV
ncbi:hypothetical protein QMK19_14710 [Streptomyces sp. H10-C2]|uniref:hypothetical protein n=1 Tax=unclassified Streptomyces TaxID=2593676 RepID=UPI0024B8A877|nr:MULTISPECIES: hypothetical protein [unclassified Streptomyces]MDJ0341307.1 hypothetical protein [Streptomyces sp. PH10-H1]MDJ0370902.1 hypothetical protein [Streptomyces sp. H10-C2]